MFALIPAGYYVDRYGSVRVLKYGLSIMVASLVVTSASVDFVPQLFGRIAGGIGKSVMINAGTALIMECFSEPARSEHLGTAIGFGNSGNLLGPPFFGYVYAAASAHDLPAPQAWPFLFAGVFVLLTGVMSSKVDPGDRQLDFTGEYTEPEVPDTASSASLVELGGGTGVAGGTAGGARILGFYDVYRSVGLQAWVIAGSLVFSFGATTALLSAGVLELHLHGFSAGMIGLAAMPAGLGQVFLAPLGGRLGGTSKKRTLVMIGSPLVLCLCLIGNWAALTFFFPEAVYLPVCSAVFLSGAATAVIDAPTIAMMAELATMHGIGFGQAMTASELAVVFGQAIGPSFGIGALQYVSFQAICLITAASAVGVSISCAVFLRE
jgi:MFS family permease